jgi:integrase
MREYTSFLAPHIHAYAAFQIAADRFASTWETSLFLFDTHLKTRYPEAAVLTQEMVDTWCRQRETEINNSCIARVNAIVGLIRYLRQRGKTDVAEPTLPRKERSTYIPHAFTEAELKNFFRACDEIPDLPKTRIHASRRVIVPVFFRLLYSSGVRTCEARMLRTEDVNLSQGILNIRLSKGIAQHYVALHDSLIELMRWYDDAIKKYHPDRLWFFPNKNGSHFTRQWVQDHFRENWTKYNDAYATSYELRHNYAVENINSWTDLGFGFDAKLLYLSKSMGHSTVESTKYYYSLVPGMADILRAQSDEDFVIPEVDYESLQ